MWRTEAEALISIFIYQPWQLSPSVNSKTASLEICWSPRFVTAPPTVTQLGWTGNARYSIDYAKNLIRSFLSSTSLPSPPGVLYTLLLILPSSNSVVCSLRQRPTRSWNLPRLGLGGMLLMCRHIPSRNPLIFANVTNEGSQISVDLFSGRNQGTIPFFLTSTIYLHYIPLSNWSLVSKSPHLSQLPFMYFFSLVSLVSDRRTDGQ